LFADILEPLPVTDTRAPYPLSWDEQRLLFQALPTHLARMALFKVNTRTRDQEGYVAGSGSGKFAFQSSTTVPSSSRGSL